VLKLSYLAAGAALALAAAPAFASDERWVQVFHGEDDYMSLLPPELGFLNFVKIEITGTLRQAVDLANYGETPAQVRFTGSYAYLGYASSLSVPLGVFLPDQNVVQTVAPQVSTGGGITYDVSQSVTYTSNLDQFYGNAIYIADVSSMNFAAQWLSGDGLEIRDCYHCSFSSLVMTVTYDFDWEAPNPAAVPEPASWALMLGGFGIIGGAVRRSRRQAVRFGRAK